MDERCAGSQLVYIDDHSYYNPISNGRKGAVSQLVYIDDHSYYNLMSNGRKVCWLTTCLY
jgi:hypothetical protein